VGAPEADPSGRLRSGRGLDRRTPRRAVADSASRRAVRGYALFTSSPRRRSPTLAASRVLRGRSFTQFARERSRRDVRRRMAGDGAVRDPGGIVRLRPRPRRRGRGASAGTRSEVRLGRSRCPSPTPWCCTYSHRFNRLPGAAGRGWRSRASRGADGAWFWTGPAVAAPAVRGRRGRRFPVGSQRRGSTSCPSFTEYGGSRATTPPHVPRRPMAASTRPADRVVATHDVRRDRLLFRASIVDMVGLVSPEVLAKSEWSRLSALSRRLFDGRHVTHSPCSRMQPWTTRHRCSKRNPEPSAAHMHGSGRHPSASAGPLRLAAARAEMDAGRVDAARSKPPRRSRWIPSGVGMDRARGDRAARGHRMSPGPRCCARWRSTPSRRGAPRAQAGDGGAVTARGHGGCRCSSPRRHRLLAPWSPLGPTKSSAVTRLLRCHGAQHSRVAALPPQSASDSARAPRRQARFTCVLALSIAARQ